VIRAHFKQTNKLKPQREQCNVMKSREGFQWPRISRLFCELLLSCIPFVSQLPLTRLPCTIHVQLCHLLSLLMTNNNNNNTRQVVINRHAPLPHESECAARNRQALLVRYVRDWATCSCATLSHSINHCINCSVPRSNQAIWHQQPQLHKLYNNYNNHNPVLYRTQPHHQRRQQDMQHMQVQSCRNQPDTHLNDLRTHS
jgi:Zn-finger nucleic acid-binding protein